MQGCTPDTQAAAVSQEAAYGSLAPTGPDSTSTTPSSADDPVLDTPACSQSDASVSIPPDGRAVCVGPSTTPTHVAVEREQDGDGANSSSPSVEPQTDDAAAGHSSVGATVGMTPEFDGVGPSGLDAAADSEVTDLTDHSEAIAKVRLHMLACSASSCWL